MIWLETVPDGPTRNVCFVGPFHNVELLEVLQILRRPWFTFSEGGGQLREGFVVVQKQLDDLFL